LTSNEIELNPSLCNEGSIEGERKDREKDTEKKKEKEGKRRKESYI